MHAWQARIFSVGSVFALLVSLAACGGQTTAATAHPTATATHRPSVIYVAIGASDAVGVGATDPNTQGYVPVLISRLPADASALNLGISGAKVHDSLTRELPQAEAAHPTLVTVWMVGNDFRSCTALDGYLADLNTLLDGLKPTHAQVFVADLPDMSALPAMRPGSQGLGQCHEQETAAQVRQDAQAWNVKINDAVTAHGFTVVDLFTSELVQRSDYISGDGFHPSSLGYARLADLFWGAIQARHAVAAATATVT
jgi:acyl-CoA thioesterase I